MNEVFRVIPFLLIGMGISIPAARASGFDFFKLPSFACLKSTQPSVFKHFAIDPARLQSQTHLNHARIDSTLFIIPNNDGEARRAIDIMTLVAPKNLRVSPQSWGAVLDRENIPPPEDLRRLGIRTLGIFEIPGPELEEKIRRAGFEVKIFDHHFYVNTDRRHPQASLEQLAEYIGWDLDEADRSFAINDRGYIAGLKAQKMSDEAIRKVRVYDLCAQGRAETDVWRSIEDAHEAIPKLKKLGKAFLLDKSLTGETTILKQELAIATSDGLVDVFEPRPTGINYSGDPAIVRAFEAIDYGSYGFISGTYDRYGGGDPHASMFFGFKVKSAPSGITSAAEDWLPPALRAKFEEIIRAHSP